MPVTLAILSIIPNTKQIPPSAQPSRCTPSNFVLSMKNIAPFFCSVTATIRGFSHRMHFKSNVFCDFLIPVPAHHPLTIQQNLVPGFKLWQKELPHACLLWRFLLWVWSVPQGQAHHPQADLGRAWQRCKMGQSSYLVDGQSLAVSLPGTLPHHAARRGAHVKKDGCQQQTPLTNTDNAKFSSFVTSGHLFLV